MLTANQLRGIIPALPTPVRADAVDAKAVSALFAWLLQQGVDGVGLRLRVGGPRGGDGELVGQDQVAEHDQFDLIDARSR